MRVTIVEGRCQGHARCVALVPEIFDLDTDGYSFVRPGHGEIAHGDGQALERVQLAVDNCPEQAIRIEPGA